jgi:hypothetical protein
VQQASDCQPRDELGQFIRECLVGGDAERLMPEQLAVSHKCCIDPSARAKECPLTFEHRAKLERLDNGRWLNLIARGSPNK